MIERKEIERVDRLIRFRELKVSIVTECVSGKQEGEEQPLPPAFALLSVRFSSHLFTFSNFHFPPLPEAKEPNSIINSEPLSEI